MGISTDGAGRNTGVPHHGNRGWIVAGLFRETERRNAERFILMRALQEPSCYTTSTPMLRAVPRTDFMADSSV